MFITVIMYRFCFENSQLISSFKLQNSSTHSESQENNFSRKSDICNYLK